MYDTDGTTVLEEGSRIKAPFVMDLLNPFHKMGRFLSQYLNGITDTQTTGQFFKWLVANIMHRGSNFYSATTSDNINYSLGRPDDSPLVYKEGLLARFVMPALNSTDSFRVNLAGVGWKDLSDYELGVGDSPTVSANSISVGTIVKIMYVVRPSDSFGYFRIVRTPLNLLDVGDVDLQQGAGDAINRLSLGMVQIQQYFTGVDIVKTISLAADQFFAEHYTPSDNTYKRAIIDYALARYKSFHIAGSDVFTSEIGPDGMIFDGGPGSDYLSNRPIRPAVFELPLGAITFLASSSDWLAYESGGGPLYVLDTEIPQGSSILSAYAVYTTFGGEIRSAPIALVDPGIGGTSFPTNQINIKILSGDSSVPTQRPVIDSGDDYCRIFMWYDASDLLV